MQLALYKSLSDIQISDERATAIVEATEEFIKEKINSETREILAEVKAGNRLTTIGFSLVGLLVTLASIAAAYING